MPQTPQRARIAAVMRARPVRGPSSTIYSTQVSRETVVLDKQLPPRPAPAQLSPTDTKAATASPSRQSTETKHKHTPHPHKKKHRFQRFRLRTVARWLLLLVIIASAGYMAIDTYRTNSELKHRIQELSGVASTGVAVTDEQRQQAEGTDEATVHSESLDTYRVSPELPRIITIEKIGVKARIFQMGVHRDGSMQAPVGIYDAGWYIGSARPGTDGAAVIDAHSSGPTKQGLFGRLDELDAGDVVDVELGDGSHIRYRVTDKQAVPKDTVDMKKLLSVKAPAVQGLNLITCSGKWVKSQSTYSNRTIVYTEKIE